MTLLAATLPDAAPAISVALCLLAIPLIGLTRKRPNLREGVSLVTAVLNFLLVVSIYLRFRSGTPIEVEVLRVTEDLRLAFRVDHLGLIFALVASGLWILNTLYSIGYMRAHNEHKQPRFYACFAAAIAGAMGASFSANLFSLFVFYEALTLVTYPLVIHAETDVARAGAKRYLAYLLGLSLLFFLPAIFMTAATAGTLEFHPDGLLHVSEAAQGASHAWLGLIFVLFLLGIGKAAIMPFHGWLPAAMVAPTPVSALLHAVAVVKAGVFTVSRIVFHVFGVELLKDIGIADVLVIAACITIILASLLALAQTNLKRRLAYSTVSQLSYILLGIGLLVPMAQTGGLVHIGMHAASKITLFFCAGAIMVAAHKKDIHELDGIGRRMPITMGAFTVGAFSMIGLPPAAVLVSKWHIDEGAALGGYWWVVLVLVASAVLNALYYLPIVWRAFFRPSPDGKTGIKEAPWACVVALTATAVLTIVLFFFPGVFIELAHGVVQVTGGTH